MRVRALGDANLEPAAGLLPRHPLVRVGQGAGRDHRPDARPGDHRERRADRRPPPLLRPAALDRRRQRPGRVRRRRPAHRRRWRGRMGGGEVRFGGRIGIRERHARELQPDRASATTCASAIPEGFRSQVDTDLALRGPVGAPVLTGTVHVKDALFIKSVDTEGTGLFGLAASARLGRGHADDGAVRLPAPLRPEDRRAVGAAHRQHRRRAWSRAPT